MIHQTLQLYRQAYQGLSPSVWLLAGVMLINRCGTMVLPFLTLYLTQYLHFTVADTGIVMAVYGIGAFFGTFLGGRLTDRFGFYYVQLFGLLFGGAFLLVLQFVTSFYGLCGSVFVFTLFGDAFRPANQAALVHYSEPDTRTRAFSLNRLAINLGWSVGGGLGGWLAGIDYSLLFWVDGFTCLVAGGVLWFYLPVPAAPARTKLHLTEPSPDESMVSEPDQSTGSPYRDTLFIVFVVFVALYLMVFMQLFSLIPLYFKQALHLTEQRIGLLMALNGVLIVAIEMALVYKLEQQKQAKIRLITLGAVLTSLAYATLMLTDWPGIALIFILVVTLSEMLAIPFIQSVTVDRSSPTTRGQYLALYAMGGAIAQTTAPAFGSQMVAQFNFQTHWLVVSAIGLVAAGGFWWLGKRINRAVLNKRPA